MANIRGVIRRGIFNYHCSFVHSARRTTVGIHVMAEAWLALSKLFLELNIHLRLLLTKKYLLTFAASEFYSRQLTCLKISLMFVLGSLLIPRYVLRLLLKLNISSRSFLRNNTDLHFLLKNNIVVGLLLKHNILALGVPACMHF